ncbi:MAG: PPC domain-containing protein [Gemmataceae bacterium]
MCRKVWSLLCFALVSPTLASGGEKVVTVGKGTEITGEVKGDEPKVIVKVGDETLSLPSKTFQVKLEAGKSYRIAMNAAAGTDLDCFLVLQDKDGKQLAFDDDGGGGLNSLIEFTPKAAGVYKVFAAALDGAGGFTLKITAAEPAKAKRLKVGAEVTRVTDSLKDDSKRLLFEVELKAGKSYRIDLMSKAFDTFLIVQDSAGADLASDDDSGDGTDSRLVFRAPKDGVYRIVATSFSRSETGEFVLEVREEK